MKKIARYSSVGMMFLFTAAPALAATAREDNSMTLVYLFLGVCALIVFLQLLPVFALALGLLKGFFGAKDKATKPLTH